MALPTHILLVYGYLLLFAWVLVEQFGHSAAGDAGASGCRKRFRSRASSAFRLL